MTKNFAHRGVHSIYPENTMAAFHNAVELGCDGIELDVMACATGELVITHDNNICHLTGQYGLVTEMSLEELKQQNIMNGAGAFHGFNTFPTLKEYLQEFSSHPIITNIEIKRGSSNQQLLEQQLVHMIKEYDMCSRIIISSFDHYAVVRCRQMEKNIRYGFLMSDNMISPCEYTAKYAMDYLHPRYTSLSDETLIKIKSCGIGINVYTVNRKEDMRRLISAGVNGIITDNPLLLKEELMNENGI